jgi:type I site-specific restriction endonuclease
VFEEVSFTDGKITVRGKFVSWGARKRADYILYYKVSRDSKLPLITIKHVLVKVFQGEDFNQHVKFSNRIQEYK